MSNQNIELTGRIVTPGNPEYNPALLIIQNDSYSLYFFFYAGCISFLFSSFFNVLFILISSESHSY
ncbi:Uncharacterized protein BWINRA5_03386 [Bacillus mycoides]|nr:Uncharacterized protein BWINRA5_03386 [Bacillus mycoides]